MENNKKVKHHRKKSNNRKVVIHIDPSTRVSECTLCGSFVYKTAQKPTQYRYFTSEESAMRYIHKTQDKWQVKGYQISAPRKMRA